MNRLQPPTLLVIDAQAALDDPRWGRRNNPEAEAIIASLLSVWRSAGAPVIHAHHLPGEETSTFQGPGSATKPEALPQAEEWLLWKSAPSAFAGTSLSRLLAGAGAQTLAICGFVTDNSIAATAQAAKGLGYATQVVADACATFDQHGPGGDLQRAEEVHARSLADMRREKTEVVESAAFL
ncbi:cysteine hydrolase family protein [Algihabitans albus]|uniref:cysteine hydrolase family protein n=1 Tax=Algihabitans albus TaxID=2164067 RepID=UPI000E5CB38E|nr:cysteine hydrolase family protein [Algihabitans albus]